MNPFTPTIEEGRDRWLNESRKRNLRQATLRSYLHHSNYFVKAYGPRRMGLFSSRMAQDWLLGLDLSIESKKDIKRVVDQMWKYNTGRSLFGNSIRFRMDEAPVRFYTVEQAKVIMTHSPNNLRGYLALGLFAGLRPTEAARLDRPQNGWQEGIVVPAQASKVRIGRYVEPRTANVLPFLRAYGLDRTNLRRRLKAFSDSLDFEWIPDGLRHSFATYYSAIYGPGECANVLGHRSLDMLYRHYKGLATREEAALYFEINPACVVR